MVNSTLRCPQKFVYLIPCINEEYRFVAVSEGEICIPNVNSLRSKIAGQLHIRWPVANNAGICEIIIVRQILRQHCRPRLSRGSILAGKRPVDINIRKLDAFVQESL